MAIDKNLYEQDILNVSVKILILNWNETKENENKEIIDDVVASITGYCTGGSLNLNGQSTVRRTGSLSIITNQDNIIFDDDEDTAFNDVQCFDKIETLFSTNKKVKIYTGIEDENGTIQWQNQGIFIIKNPSLNRSMSGISISLTLSDKMCLLNGEMGGNLPAATVFSEMEIQHQDGTITKDYPLVKDIVETLVTQYGGVNNLSVDIDTEITKVMKWGLDRDLYKYELNGSKFLSLTFSTNYSVIDPTKSYLLWEGNSINLGTRTFSTHTIIDYGDGTVIEGDGTVQIGEHKFIDGASYHVITIDGLNKLEDFAIFAEENLLKIIFANNLKYFTYAYNPLKGSINLKEIQVNPGSSTIKAKGNCLISLNYIITGCQNSIIPEDENINYIAANAFADINLKKIIIPSNITYIHSSAFNNSNLKEVILKEGGCGVIGPGAFQQNQIKELTIPKSCKNLLVECFADNPLERIYYNGSKTDWSNIGKNAKWQQILSDDDIFYKETDENDLAALEFVPSKVVTKDTVVDSTKNYYIYNITTYSYILQENLTEFLSGMTYYEESQDTYDVQQNSGITSYPKNITIPNIYNKKRVIQISVDGFRNCNNLKTIYIPENITRINARAFDGTHNLRNISLPKTLLVIGKYCFQESGIIKITIPSTGYIAIDAGAFVNMYGLLTITFKNSHCIRYSYLYDDNILVEMIKPITSRGELRTRTYNNKSYYNVTIYYNKKWGEEIPFSDYNWPADNFLVGEDETKGNFVPTNFDEEITQNFGKLPIDIEDLLKGQEVTAYKYNDTVGYIKVPFTWPGQTLSANAGETITSVLDKIKALADYEYFFDTEGKFIWQKKNTYVYPTLRQGTETTITNDMFFNSDLSKIKEIILPKAIDAKNVAYKFDTTNLITSLTNTPQYNNMKNDFIIWGKRKTASGAELPIRYRLVFSRGYPKTKVETNTIDNCREYEVADGVKGYKKYEVKEKTQISELPFSNDDIYYKIGTKYYHWVDDKYQVTTETPGGQVLYNEKDKYQTQIYLDGVDKDSVYFDSPLYKDLEIEWPKLYDVTADVGSRNWRTGSAPQGDEIDYYCHLIDVPGQNIEDVGRYQTKVINDNTVNCIYAPDIPAEILNKVGDKYPIDLTNKTIDEINAYNIINVPEEIYNNLYAGGTQSSAFELARRVVNYYTSYNNTISLSCIPIYDLKPNDIIQVEDDKSGIHGYYIVNTISLPLTYNGTMNISASRALTQEATGGNTK